MRILDQHLEVVRVAASRKGHVEMPVTKDIIRKEQSYSLECLPVRNGQAGMGV